VKVVGWVESGGVVWGECGMVLSRCVMRDDDDDDDDDESLFGVALCQ
jgi:hypothetical protein